MFYSLRFNLALAMLGVDPSHLNPMFRWAALADGKLNRHTPQEAVVMFLPHLGLRHRAGADPNVVKRWIRKGKVAPDRYEIALALSAIGWADFWS